MKLCPKNAFPAMVAPAAAPGQASLAKPRFSLPNLQAVGYFLDGRGGFRY
jgi:hypothetical protein